MSKSKRVVKSGPAIEGGLAGETKMEENEEVEDLTPETPEEASQTAAEEPSEPPAPAEVEVRTLRGDDATVVIPAEDMVEVTPNRDHGTVTIGAMSFLFKKGLPVKVPREALPRLREIGAI